MYKNISKTKVLQVKGNFCSLHFRKIIITALFFSLFQMILIQMYRKTILNSQLFQKVQSENLKSSFYYKNPHLLKSKKILVWNKYWGLNAVWHKIFYEILERSCPLYNNCILTSNRDELETSEAVLIHLIDLSSENYQLPHRHNQNQLWIAMSYEPPYVMKYSGLNFTLCNGIFNRTMGYRSDSDIVVQHGTFTKYSEKDKLMPFFNYKRFLSNWVNSYDSIVDRNYADGKKRLVAWFASSHNCKSQSQRELYVDELENYIPIDIYGACGPFKCGVQKTMRYPYSVEHDDCYMLISKGYKFVLAFENSICKDYVTEKLYNHLKLNVIPIVFGGANYSTVAPPFSVIDASKYTPKALAEYLYLLNENDTLYNEYFSWKKDFYIESHDGIPMVCDLCEKINEDYERHKVYERLDLWLDSGCTNPHFNFSKNSQNFTYF